LRLSGLPQSYFLLGTASSYDEAQAGTNKEMPLFLSKILLYDHYVPRICEAASELVSAEIKKPIPTFTDHELPAGMNRDGTFAVPDRNTVANSCDAEGEQKENCFAAAQAGLDRNKPVVLLSVSPLADNAPQQ
jgi:hypothetical protein